MMGSTAIFLLAANVIPDTVYALYSGVSTLYSESKCWIAVAAHREELPALKPRVPRVILPYNSATPGKTYERVEWDGHILHEVRSLKDLPSSLQAVLGVPKPSWAGIADRDGQVTGGCLPDFRLPRRRFVVAGLDGDAALIAVEHEPVDLNLNIEVSHFSNIGQKPVFERRWGLNDSPRTLRELVDAISPR